MTLRHHFHSYLDGVRREGRYLANALCEVWDALGLRYDAINHVPMLRPQSFITAASQYFH